MTLFLVSFLVLFLEVALIRWMPAYIRLLSYFSNFILLASFLGIGIGCLLARARRSAFALFPLVMLGVIVAVDRLRLEVTVSNTASIYFTSGTTEKVVAVESTLLLPLLFVVVAALFVTIAQRMGRELAARPPLEAYSINLAGSLTGVAAFAVMSWLQLPPSVWFATAFAAALGIELTVAVGLTGAGILERGRVTAAVGLIAAGIHERRGLTAAINLILLVVSLVVVHGMERGSLWSPYYRITVHQDAADTVVEVNNIFHQSMAPVDRKEYFYQWPYAVFGDTFDDVLILGAGSGTDVAAALKHGAKHVDAVEIDPVILQLGAERHPDRPYSDPRVTAICDDARHFLRTTTKKYDLVVFALVDSLTLQSSFSGVRLESYMFTEESFRAVRDHLKPRGAMALYNYFREKWLVDRLANTVAMAFDEAPNVHVHQDRAYLAVMLAGPRLRETTPPEAPHLTVAYGQPQAPSPPRALTRDTAVVPATDDWPFLYLRAPQIPAHYLGALALVLTLSAAAVAITFRATRAARSGAGSTWSWHFFWHFFFLGAGFMLLETKSIVQFALLWGSTWSTASLAIASVLAMALASTVVAARIDVRRPWIVGLALLGLLALNYALPVGRIPFESRAAESIFSSVLVFSPVFCAGLLFSGSFKRSASAAPDFGANLLGAMAGGVGEYLSLVTGYRFLLLLVAGCYVAAMASRLMVSEQQTPRATPRTG